MYRGRERPGSPNEARRALARRARIRGHEPRHRKEQGTIAWFCTAFGFEKDFVAPGEGGEIAHAQLRFGNGTTMCGSARDDGWGKLVKAVADVGSTTGAA